jgi:hypothetical protein
MTPSAYVKSTDSRAQGAAVGTGGSAWVVVSSISGAALTGSLTIPTGLTCPCTFVVGDLTPGASVQAAGQSATVNSQGVLTFTVNDAATTSVTLTGL